MPNNSARTVDVPATAALPAALHELMDISIAMCANADDGNWQTVAALHARFSRKLPEVFADEDAPQTAWAETIRGLIENARRVSDEARRQRDAAQEALRKIRVSAPAVRAYAVNNR